jgi:predicted nucleotidyltransferase
MGLTREQIVAALDRLDAQLESSGAHASIYLVGGAVMCLVLNTRDSTKDVDAWFSDPQIVREAAQRVAEELDLPQDWLNDAAKAFVPPRARFEAWRSLPHLDIYAAADETLFAMKCAAARTEQDADDIRALAERLSITSASVAIEVVLKYFPAERLPVRTQLLLEELFDERD